MRPKSDKKMISVRLSEGLMNKVKQTAKDNGLTVTEYIEKSIQNNLASVD